MNDKEIIGAVLDGQTRRFEVLVDRYLGMIRGLCASYVAQPSPCEDLVQETFIDGYTQLGRLRHPERFAAWLARIARNKCISWIRRESRRKEVHEQIQREPLPLGEDILSSLTRQELRDYVRRSMKKLPAKTREAMMLCYIEGLSGQEIAAALDISESAVKKRLQYGREILSSSLWNVVHDTEDDKDKLKKQVMAGIPFGTVPLKISLFGTIAAKLLTVKAISIAALVAIIAIAASWLLVKPITQSEALNAATIISSPEIGTGSNEQESVSKTDEGVITPPANQPEGEESLQIQAVQEYEPKIHIHGTVFMANTNEPISEAKVEFAYDSVNRYRAITNDEGFFEFNTNNIRNGKYPLTVNDDSYFMKNYYEGVYNKGIPSEPVRIEVYKRGTITGIVKLPDGTPVPELTIMVGTPDGSARGSIETDEQGRYTIPNDGGEIRFYAVGIGAARSEDVTLNLRVDESIEHDILFPKITRLLFRLTMPNGSVVKELKYVYIDAEPDNGYGSSGPRNRLPKDGEWFVVPHASPGTYNFVFSTEEKAIGTIEEIHIGPTDREKRFNVAMEQGAETLSVLVLDYEGVPIPEQSVSISKRFEMPSHGVILNIENSETDAQGRCIFQHLTREEIRIDTTIKEESLERNIILPHTGDVVLQAQKKKDTARKVRVELNVTVTSEGNRPLDNHQAVWHWVNRDTGECSPEFSYGDKSVTTGDYTLFYAHIGYTSGVKDFTVPDDPDMTKIIVDLPLEEGGAIYGEIHSSIYEKYLAESPDSIMNICIFPETLAPLIKDKSIRTNWNYIGELLTQQARTDDDGTFYVPNLPSGNYLVGFNMNSWSGAWEILDNLETGPKTIKFLTGPWEVLANHETGPITVSPRS